jgi:hypothetical protein
MQYASHSSSMALADVQGYPARAPAAEVLVAESSGHSSNVLLMLRVGNANLWLQNETTWLRGQCAVLRGIYMQGWTLLSPEIRYWLILNMLQNTSIYNIIIIIDSAHK